MKTYDLAKEFLSEMGYQIIDESREDCHIAFRYQINTVHFWANVEDEHFFFMTIANFAEVTNDNIALVKDYCHQVNREIKAAKLYTLNDVILAATEICYLAKEDFKFQMQTALRHLVSAKAMYKKLDQ